MAEIDPLDPNQDNLDNLRESINLSSKLIDNAKQLYKLNKDSASELYKSFRDASKQLAKSLSSFDDNYKKFFSLGIQVKDVQKEIQKIESLRTKTLTNQILLEERVKRIREEKLLIQI